MSYENAPSTQMLATHCAVCDKALRDAVSVDLGIGPDCRKRYGFNVEIDPDKRSEANAIIHALALHRSGKNPNPRYPIEAIARVRALGLARLADTLASRLAKVEISKLEDGRIGVSIPYSEEAVSALWHILRQGTFDRAQRLNVFPDDRSVKAQLWAVLKRLFPGELVRLPNGNLTLAQ